MTCADCGRELCGDELGLSRKLISRATRVFYCLACLSAAYRVPEDNLRGMADRYRAAGCTLFPARSDLPPR